MQTQEDNIKIAAMMTIHFQGFIEDFCAGIGFEDTIWGALLYSTDVVSEREDLYRSVANAPIAALTMLPKQPIEAARIVIKFSSTNLPLERMN